MSSYPVWIPYTILGGVAATILVSSFIISFLFKNPKHKAKLPLFVSSLGVSAVLFCVCIIPVDIFTISQTVDPTVHGRVIRILYYAGYLTLFVFAFTLIPFAYFYYEEGHEEYTNVVWRIVHALKFTIFALIVGGVLFVIIIGLTLGLTRDDDDTLNWLKNLAHDKTIGDKIVSSLISVIAIIGLLAFWVYTGYGLAALPISLIKGKKRLKLEMGSIAEELSYVTERIRIIKEKYALTGNKMSKSDQREFNSLKERQQLLRTRDQALISTSKTWTAKCEPLIYPFKLVTGIVLFIITLALMVSFIITLVDRVIHSPCGIHCGFVIDKSYIFNPFDELLTISSKAFPIDYVLFGIFILFMIVVSLVGLANIGLRFVCIKLYKLKYKKTAPQGLLTTCIFLMFIVVVFSFTMTSFAPKYTTFGTQKYMNAQGEWIDCDFNAVSNGTHPNGTDPHHNQTRVTSSSWQHLLNIDERFGEVIIPGRPCYMSQLSTLMNGVALKGVQIYTIIFYFGNWVFVGSYFLSVVIAFIRKPASFLPDEDEDEDDDDDEVESLYSDRSSLMRSTRRYSTDRKSVV